MAKTNISNKAERNQLNITIRSQPWYQDFFKSKGLDPNKVQLSKEQQQELQQLTVANGFLDPSDGHIDPAGNVSDFHGWKGLPTAAKVALIAGATAATAGAAGAFGGGASVAPGLTASVGAPAATSAGILGGTTGTIAGTVGTGLSTYGKIANVLGSAGRGVGAATTAAGANRLENEDREARAAQINIQGQQAQANQDMEARKNLYRASVARNPMAGPNNARGLPTISPEMMQGLSSLEKAALNQTASAQTRQPFVPYKPNLKKSTMEQIGTYAGPTMSTISNIASMIGQH